MFNDRDILNDSLKDQKYITSSYNAYSNEASNDSLRRELLNILMEEHQIHDRIFETMTQKGYYQPPPANPQRISQARNQFSTMSSTSMTMGSAMGQMGNMSQMGQMSQFGQSGQGMQASYQSPTMSSSTQGAYSSPYSQSYSFQGTSGQGLFSGGIASSASSNLQRNFQNIKSSTMNDFSETNPGYYSEVQGMNNQNRASQSQGTTMGMSAMNAMNTMNPANNMANNMNTTTSMNNRN